MQFNEQKKPATSDHIVFEVFCNAIACNAIIESGIALVMGECDRLSLHTGDRTWVYGQLA
jgi:hypothetical protein